ncbi:endonuclease [Desulforamulus profundi]|uniref:Endonuclease n=1 Tax=Desulforamulus profundi TaxID=1383067 RepID=A0A2C6M3J9_9FIRM|nr:endonuclease/exonuclease/phosphatase family protein [Desulforamulus profundi]PHJ36697.1 endonuclease [Desulforamulus profundi]
MQAIRIVSYNIRHARGLDAQVDLNRVAGVLARSGARLIGLQEVDKHLPRSYFQHQAKSLGYHLNQCWAFGPNLHWGAAQYGNAVLSHWPILQYRQYLLPSKGEQRGLLEAEIQLDHRRINFFCTHMGLNREERLEQAQAIVSIISQTSCPVILVGDFNDERTSREYRLITSVLLDATSAVGGFKTYPSNQPEEQIDFVFISPEWRVLTAFPIESDASDHLPVLVELMLDQEDEEYYNDIKNL